MSDELDEANALLQARKATNAYEAAIQAASSEILKLRDERARIDKRIKYLTETLATLFRLTVGETPGNVIGMGLTDALRKMLALNYPRAITPAHAVYALSIAGYDFSNYKNKQASVNGTLQRLVTLGEVKVKKVTVGGGDRVQGYVLREAPPAEQKAAALEEKS